MRYVIPTLMLLFFSGCVSIDDGSQVSPELYPPTTPNPPVTGDSVARFAFTDVDQGDGIVIIAPDTVTVFDTGRNTQSSWGGLVAYLDEHQVTTINHLFISHTDADHSGGCDVLFERYNILEFYYPGNDKDTMTWQECLAAAQDEGSTIHTDFTTLSPGDDLSISSHLETIILSIDGSDPDHNEGSIALKLRHGNNHITLMGDAGCTTEREIMAMFPAEVLATHVLQAGHHGSKYSTCADWLRVTEPDHVVISVGSNNYGHPTEDVLTRIQNQGSHIYRTDAQGTVEFVSDGTNLTVNRAAWTSFDTPSAQSGLVFSAAQFDAPGNDNDNLNEEWIDLTNYDNTPYVLTDWYIQDEAALQYYFPDFTLAPGDTVRLHTGAGTDTATNLYWGRSQGVWNNSGDTAYLYNDQAELVTSFSG